MRHYAYAAICISCFAGGAYVWKIANTGLSQASKAPIPSNKAAEIGGPQTVVEVGAERISQDDIDWEYGLVTEGIFDKDSLTPIPDLGARYHAELAPLRKQLVSAVIERKLLYQFVQQDHDFTANDPARYSKCLTQWQEVLKSQGPEMFMNGGKDRLKSRLCERSILDQYIKERLFKDIAISEAEIVEYFKNHLSEFQSPEKIEVRQVLLGSEDEAKRWRAQINPHNFESIARQYSIAPEGAQGGHLGPFAKGSMPAVFEAAFHLKKGEISPVLKSNYGYHIILLLEHYPKVEPSLEQARPKVFSLLRKKKQDEAYEHWVEKALAAINVMVPKAAF